MGMQTVILAGGLATRLRPLSEKIPKSMIMIHDRPFLEYQLDLLKRSNIDEVILCVGYLSDQIKEYFKNGEGFGIKIKYSDEQKKLLGTAGALKKAEKLLEDEFFVMYGDSYLLIDFKAVMQYFKKHGKPSLMTVYKNYDNFDKSNVAIDGNLVKRHDKTNKTADMVYIDYGLSILNKKVLKNIPTGEFYSLEDLFKKIIVKKELLAFEVSQRFYEVGSFNGIEDFKAYVERVEA